MKTKQKFVIRAGVLMTMLALLSACQSHQVGDNTQKQSTLVGTSFGQDAPKKASELFALRGATSEATAQMRLAEALKAHLAKERVVATNLYYQERPNIAPDSLNAGADALWVSIMKVREASRQSRYEEPTNHAYRSVGEYSDGEGLYLRYYDEVDGALPSEDYDLTRLDGLGEETYKHNVDIRIMHRDYQSCVKRASYSYDELVGNSPNITMKDKEARAVFAELSSCISEVDKEADELLPSVSVYQAQDIKTIRQCASSYKTNIQDVLAVGRAQNYEGEHYDAYDSVYGNYALCTVEYWASMRSDPAEYIERETTKSQLDFIKEVRQCAISNRERLTLLASDGKTYKTHAKEYETSFYEYFACIDDGVVRAYDTPAINDGADDEQAKADEEVIKTAELDSIEAAQADAITNKAEQEADVKGDEQSEVKEDTSKQDEGEAKKAVAPTNMQEAKEAYERHTSTLEQKEEELYGEDEEEGSGYRGFVGSLFDEYFKMKKAELKKDKSERPTLTGLSGLYGELASELVAGLQKTQNQMLATNIYRYDNTQTTLLTHHNPMHHQSQGVLSLAFESPVASQSVKFPLRADFLKGRVVADVSPLLPIGALIRPDVTPAPSDFEGKVGVVEFRMPDELGTLVPTAVVYDSLARGVGQAMAELDPMLFTALDISDDPFAKEFGASRAVKVNFGTKQVGEFVSLISKQLIKDLSAYVEAHPEIYEPTKLDDQASPKEELEHKAKEARIKRIKTIVEQWALLDKGHTSADVGGILSIISGFAPVDFYQTNYYYLGANGQLVGQVVKSDAANRATNTKTETLAVSRFSYQVNDFNAHTLMSGVAFDDKALDGNAWFEKAFGNKTLQTEAEEARQSYQQEEGFAEGIVDAILETLSFSDDNTSTEEQK